MANNVYQDFHDTVCENMVNERIARLKSGGIANQIPRFSDRSKPALNPRPLPAIKIGKTADWPKKLHVALPE